MRVHESIINETMEEANKFSDINSMQSSFTYKLQQSMIDSQIPQKHSDNLLKLMQQHSFPSFSVYTKTFLNSNLKFQIEEIKVSIGSVGLFYHFGVQKKLEDTVKYELHEIKLLELTVNLI